jgi:3-oxoacyl-[acyl-carrier-protein] synthase I
MRAIAIEALGAITAVGENLPLSVASIYTGGRRCEALGTHGVDGRPVIGAPAMIGDQVRGIDRLRVLALMAIQECVGDQLGVQPPLPVVVCAPVLEPFGRDAGWFLHRLLDDADLALDPDGSRVIAGGRGVLPDALALAEQRLASQEWPACFLVGVDSLVAPPRLSREVDAGRVAGAGNATGFIPGEAGAALLLSLRADAGSAAIIAGIGRCEGGAAFNTTAAVLADAAERALANAGVAAPALGAICHDGPGDWAQLEELALADARPPLSLVPEAQRLIPSISTGEVGAAAGVLSLAIVGLLLAKGVVQRPALAMLVAEGPARAAAVLTPATAAVRAAAKPRPRRSSGRLNDAQSETDPDRSDERATADAFAPPEPMC